MLPQSIRQTADLAACWWFDGVCFYNIVCSNQRDFVCLYLLEQDFPRNRSGIDSKTRCYIEHVGRASRMHCAESVRRPVYVVDWLIRPEQIMIEDGNVCCKRKCKARLQLRDDRSPCCVKMALPPHGGSVIVLARNAKAIREMRGGSIPTKDVIRRAIAPSQIVRNLRLNGFRRRM